MRIAATMTEKRLRSLTKSTACGVVPGFWVSVKKLKDGSYRKYFVLRERTSVAFFPTLNLASRRPLKRPLCGKTRLPKGLRRGR